MLKILPFKSKHKTENFKQDGALPRYGNIVMQSMTDFLGNGWEDNTRDVG
jgi:hypothetical protein